MPPAKIVVADDDADQLEITCFLLEKEGYHVVRAATGAEALRQIVQHPPDLVLSDVEMPEMSGLEVARRMSQDPVLRNVPVILLSGKRMSQEDRIQGLGSGGDDYLTKPFPPAELIARVRAVLRRTEIGLDANPLTRLPGNSSILREIEYRLSRQEPFAILYADLNNFKAFNDSYGFLKGDEVIRFTARVLLDAAQAFPGQPFVGHVGGDDFVLAAAAEHAEPLCRAVIERFDAGISQFYRPEDLARKGIEIKDRVGQLVFYPIMGISIGVVTNMRREIRSMGEVSQIGAEMKKKAKSLPGSRFAIDQRGA
jgi:diguanylate cyclase (GGDEF)-like protein